MVVDESKMELITVLFAEIFNNWVIDPFVIECVRARDFKLKGKHLTHHKVQNKYKTDTKTLEKTFNKVLKENKSLREINKFCSKQNFSKNETL